MQYVILFPKVFDCLENEKIQLTLKFWSFAASKDEQICLKYMWHHLFLLSFLQYVILFPKGFDCLENAKIQLTLAFWSFGGSK